jgi:four helix bundle protein
MIMATISHFEEIEAWKTARQLTNLVYQVSGLGPFSKDFGLKDQIRRAAISVMSNIAEGFESRTQAQFINYLGIAKASAAEVRSQVYITSDQKYVTQEQFKQVLDLSDKAIRQLASFISYLESNPKSRAVREDRPEYNISPENGKTGERDDGTTEEQENDDRS